MNICVYGAASDTIDKAYIGGGELLGSIIAQRNHGVVFGGGATGMMGAVARGAHQANGYILGIAPRFFDADGILYENCSEFIYTDTMRERKKLLEEKADAFIVTPGGPGTFDEFFEIFTLKQLSRHTKAIALYNLNRYFDPLIELLENMINQNFMKPKNRNLYFASEDPDAIIDYIENYTYEDVELTQLKDINSREV